MAMPIEPSLENFIRTKYIFLGRKKKKETEISQSRRELVVNEKTHDSQTPIESIRGSSNQHSSTDSKHNNW